MGIFVICYEAVAGYFACYVGFSAAGWHECCYFSGSPGSGYILFFGVRAMEPFPHWGAREKAGTGMGSYALYDRGMSSEAMEFHA